MVGDEWRAGRSGRLDPFPGVIDMGVGVDGADDVAGRNLDFACLLEEAFEHGADIPLAPRPKPSDMGMAVNGVAAGEAVFVGDNLGAAPLEESCFDGAAFRVAADAALARVAFKVGRRGAAGQGTPCGRPVGFYGFSAHAPR